MLFSRIPPVARLISDRYKDIFRSAGIPYSMLCILIVMILCGFPAISKFVKYFVLSLSVSAISRSIKKFDKNVMNLVQRRIAWSVLKQVVRDPENWIWVIDTTANIKRTANLPGRGLWANSKNEIFFGQNMMMICAVNTLTGASIPVYWLPFLKPNERKKGHTNHNLVLELVDALIEQEWPKLTLVMDSWFDSASLLQALNKRKIIFVVELKSSRKPKTNPGLRVSKKHLVDIFKNLNRESIRCTTREIKEPVRVGWKNLRFVSGQNIWINGRGETSKQIQLHVAAVYNHPKEKKAFGYYATNDLSKPYTWCWKMSRYRWNAEVCFRDLRQGFNWGKLPAKSVECANFSWVMPILILAYIREYDPKSTILSFLEKTKDEELMRSINYYTKNPDNFQIKKLRIRLLGTPPCKKVRITAAEKERLDQKSNLSNKSAA